MSNLKWKKYGEDEGEDYYLKDVSRHYSHPYTYVYIWNHAL